MLILSKLTFKVDIMNKKINTICFIFLLFFMICAVSAADENETLQSIEQPDPNQDLCKISVENAEEKLESSNIDYEKLEATKSTVKETVTLKAPNVKMHYNDGSVFKVTAIDKNKKAIQKAKIEISVNGKTYSKLTDKKGTTSFNLNLKSGSYVILTTFVGTNKYESKTLKSAVVVKSTIKCSDLTKHYKNTACYYSTFYDKKGKLLKNTPVKIKLNGKTYSIKTNSKGVGKLSVDLMPGKYSITSINSKTQESVTKTVTIKTLIESTDLTIDENTDGEFNVKILNIYGKVSPNKKVIFKLNGKTYTKTTNKNGIANLNVNLESGTYIITTEYYGLQSKNKITVNQIPKPTSYSHIIQIPSYVNITHPYVFEGSGYIIKSGIDGIIRMPKNEVFTINIKNKTYSFSKNSISGVKTTLIGYKYHLIPFDAGPVQSEFDKKNLKGNGIIISSKSNYTEIEYRSATKYNTELFGFYADSGSENSEIITYMENSKVTAKINILTLNYDELGLKYSLSKYYGRSVYDFNYKSYDEYTYQNTDLIKFANTNKAVTFSLFGNSIVGPPSKEDINTKFIVNGVEELEKQETISYGLGEKYRRSLGFEVLQAFSIINERITKEKLEKWVSVNGQYLDKFGVMNVYGMHLASLETTWLADEFADKYSKEFGVTWKRNETLTILGGINLDDTYLNILNADMGMSVKGKNESNEILFRMMNSINLPILEDYALKEVGVRFWDNTTNSLDNVFSSITKGKFSIAQLGELIYLFSEDGSNSGIVINSTNGVANVIISHGNSIYKGSAISTTPDCCSVGIIPKDIIAGIRNTINAFSSGLDSISKGLEKIHPYSILAYQAIKFGLGYLLRGTLSLATRLFTVMTVVQTIGTTYKDKMVNQKDWHSLMDTITFTRPGYLQSKKIYNIPNKDGGYDYIEVKIKDNLVLDRNNAIYISDGKTKKLTSEETYKYFTQDYWSPFSMPEKYWDKSWKGD